MPRYGCPSKSALSIDSRSGCGQIVHIRGKLQPPHLFPRCSHSVYQQSDRGSLYSVPGEVFLASLASQDAAGGANDIRLVKVGLGPWSRVRTLFRTPNPHTGTLFSAQHSRCNCGFTAADRATPRSAQNCVDPHPPEMIWLFARFGRSVASSVPIQDRSRSGTRPAHASHSLTARRAYVHNQRMAPTGGIEE